MAADPAENQARQALRRFSLPAPAHPAPLARHGGFSGARLWRVPLPERQLCLRAWPPGDPSAERLTQIHRLMRAARSAGLTWVPALLTTPTAQTWVEQGGRLWEVSDWMPGRPPESPVPLPKLETACAALARLHHAWENLPPVHAPCPAVARRLTRAAEWIERIQSGWRPSTRALPGHFHPLLAPAWQLVRQRIPDVPQMLSLWADVPVPLQPCLCDARGEHFLFTADTLAGLVDFGGVKPDHVAVDLARLLGDLAGNDPGAWEAGLRAYTRLHPLTNLEQTLTAVLDETGTLIGVANWLRWLCIEERSFEEPTLAAARLRQLVERRIHS